MGIFWVCIYFACVLAPLVMTFVEARDDYRKGVTVSYFVKTILANLFVAFFPLLNLIATVCILSESKRIRRVLDKKIGGKK